MRVCKILHKILHQNQQENTLPEFQQFFPESEEEGSSSIEQLVLLQRKNDSFKVAKEVGTLVTSTMVFTTFCCCSLPST
jgi:hypothetical protein